MCVRRALVLSANRQQLADALLEGKVSAQLPARTALRTMKGMKYPFDARLKPLDEAGQKGASIR